MAEILLMSMFTGTTWPVHVRKAPARCTMACMKETVKSRFVGKTT